jgi:hypothetical protein
MIPKEIKFDANATPPQWTDNGEQIIEKGTNVRIKIKGLRSEVDKMYAIGTMKEVCQISILVTNRPLIMPPRTISDHYRLRKLDRNSSSLDSECYGSGSRTKPIRQESERGIFAH